MRQLTLDDAQKALTLSVLLMTVDQLMTELEGTILFKQDVKSAANRLKAAIEKNAKDIDELFEMEPLSMQALYERLADFVPTTLKLKPDDWQYVVEVPNIITNPQWLKCAQLKAVLSQPNR